MNTFRKYIANESFEFQHLKCNRATKKKSNELWAIDSHRKCILKRCVALSFNRATYPFTGTLHTHAPKQYNARRHTVHLSVCQPEWNWANKICDHIYLSMLHRAYFPFTEWKCENKACFVRLKSIVQCERSYVCEMICNLNVFITTKRTALAIIKCLCAGIVCIWVCFVDLVFVVELYHTILSYDSAVCWNIKQNKTKSVGTK